MRKALGGKVEPLCELPCDLPVLGRPLSEVQEQVLRDCGLILVEKTEEPALIIGDHVWFTAPLIRAFLDKCPPTGGQLVISGPFWEFSKSLQTDALMSDGRMPIYMSPTGASWESLSELPAIEVDLGGRFHESGPTHFAFSGVADQPIPVTDKMVHTIEHWVHLHRVNLLALMAYGEGERLDFERSWWLGKLWRMLGVVIQARSFNSYRIAEALTSRGRNCKVHPTATVEASVLGDEVEVGPYAVVRGSYVGSGAVVQEHAQVQLSILNAGAIVGRSAMVRMCLLLERAMVSKCFGAQASVFGRDAFVAVGATLYDLSFGGPIKVSHKGKRVSSGTRFLGSCIGHRAKVGPHVRIGYGEMVPNDAFLVADPQTVVRQINELNVEANPHFWSEGQLKSLKE